TYVSTGTKLPTCMKKKRGTHDIAADVPSASLRRNPPPQSAAVDDAYGERLQAHAGSGTMKLKQRRPRRRARRRGWEAWARWAVEVVAVLTVALIAVIAAVGRLADALTGAAGWGHLVPFAAGGLGAGRRAAAPLRGWPG